MKKYDYLIVGAGLFGSVFAREMTDAGKRCLVVDKRDHVAGNAYTEMVEGIAVHRFLYRFSGVSPANAYSSLKSCGQ